MSPLRALARTLLAAMFVAGGADALRDPAARVGTVRAAGLPSPELLVRVNALVHLLGGLALATGRGPRPAALALAGSLVPTTLVGHPFWSAPPDQRQGQQIHCLKNAGLLGGLLLAATEPSRSAALPAALDRMRRPR